MDQRVERPIRRRQFLAKTLQSGALAGTCLLIPTTVRGGDSESSLRAGEGVVDITPPLGIEIGGFHREPGNERRIRGIRQSTAARALVLQLKDSLVAIVSLDTAGVASDVARRVQRQVADQVGIPASNVRVCATHTHSMPGFFFARQWGAIPKDYMATVEKKAVEAVKLAKADLAPARLMLGKSRAVGGNFNRTSKTFKTDEQFSKGSTDAERWLDTMVHVMLFERSGGRRNLLWYHFAAHPVCYADEQAGPDWPGLVDQKLRDSHQLTPSFLQGHAGDVNPGSGNSWRGDAEQTATAVHTAIRQAMDGLVRINVDTLRSRTEEFGVPLDMELFKDWLARYRNDPSKCTSGEWVDAGFARAWFETNTQRKLDQTHLPVMLSALRVGNVGLVFHPAEFYSYYGLAVRRDSPLSDTIVVGYTDGLIGYLADPQAYQSGEYAATTVPKILDFPPFTPQSAGELASGAIRLLKKIGA